jgi:hypothetical protein
MRALFFGPLVAAAAALTERLHRAAFKGKIRFLINSLYGPLEAV